MIGINLEDKTETIITIMGLLGACALLAWMFFFMEVEVVLTNQVNVSFGEE
jgi:hypothetical protein